MLHIGLLVSAGFDLSSFSSLSVFETANLVVGDSCYETRLLSEHGGELRSSSGVDVLTHPVDDDNYDTILIAGGDSPDWSNPAIVELLRDAGRLARRLVSFRFGVFGLGDAGLLDGRRATTHWSCVDELRKRCPLARVENDSLFVSDGPIWTSAGMTASVDLAMSLLEADLGSETAVVVAREQVLGQRRHSCHPQQSMMLEIAPKSDRVQRALTYARANLRSRLMVEELADVASLSPRQFTRLFSSETGCSPARAVEKLRAESAHLLVSQGRLALDTIAQETGFADSERMRRAFVRNYGQTPYAIRREADPRVNI